MIRVAHIARQGSKFNSTLCSRLHRDQQTRKIDNYRWGSHKLLYEFSKKAAKKVEAPRQRQRFRPKTQMDYAVGPDSVKKHYVQIQNMQTTSQANLEEQSLRKVITAQRSYLQKSLLKQNEMVLEGKEQEAPISSSRSRKIISEVAIEEIANKYYMHRPLKYLQNVFVNLFAFNLIGVSSMEIMEYYDWLGWFYGLVVAPGASTALALMLGYNLAFWTVRQSFYLHISTPDLQTTKINMISNTYRNIVELLFLALQGGALMYVTFFPMSFPLYKAYLLLGTTNFLSLYMNLSLTCASTNIPLRTYIQNYVKLISAASLLLLLFTFYELQFKAAKTPQMTYDSQAYRKRLSEMDQGYSRFKKALKAQNFIMKQDEKINSFDRE